MQLPPEFYAQYKNHSSDGIVALEFMCRDKNGVYRQPRDVSPKSPPGTFERVWGLCIRDNNRNPVYFLPLEDPEITAKVVVMHPRLVEKMKILQKMTKEDRDALFPEGLPFLLIWPSRRSWPNVASWNGSSPSRFFSPRPAPSSSGSNSLGAPSSLPSSGAPSPSLRGGRG